MAAAITDLFNNATESTRPDPAALTAQKLIGATSITVDTTAGWPTSTAVHFTMYQVDASGNKVANTQTDWKGIVTSGTTIGTLTLKAGTDAVYPVGSKVICAPTGAWADDLATGLQVAHDQDGTLKAGAVDNTAVIGSGVVEQTNLKEKLTDYSFDFVASGCVWSGDAYGSTRVASMTSGVVYIGGVKVTVSAVTSRTFTASRDTYIDVGTDGVVDYNEVTNNAASPALAASHIRLGIIVTGASNIANVGSVNQGQEDKVLPIVSSVPLSVTDTIGNLICPRDSRRTLLGYKQRTSSAAVASATPTAIAELSCPVIIPTGRKVKIIISGRGLYSTTSNAAGIVGVYDGAVGGTLLGSTFGFQGGGGGAAGLSRIVSVTPSSTSKTYNVGLSGSSGTGTVDAATTDPFSIRVELA